MHDDHVDATPVTFAGQDYTLKPSLKGIMLAAERHGITIRAAELSRGEMSLTLLSKLAYTGFLTDEPRLSYEDFVARAEEATAEEMGALNRAVLDQLGAYGRCLAKLGALRTNGQAGNPTTASG